MIEARACPECGAGVPTGRFSCGACGALLASVDAHHAADLAPVGATPSGWDNAAPESPPEARVDAEPAPTGDATAIVPEPDRSSEASNAAGAPAAPPATPTIPATLDAPHDARPAAPHEEPDVDPREAQAPATRSAPDGIELPRPPMPPIPGAYLVPSSVMRSAPSVATRPAPAGAPPRRELSSPIEPAPGSPARAPVLELPFAIAPGIGPRLVAGGAALAAVAFVLPWVAAGGVVVGGAFGSGYFATWGLAAVGNVLPFLLAWVSLVLAVLPNRLPRFAALGVLPLFLGGIFAGLAWTYLIAPLGTGVGIWALAASALSLAAGGTLVLRETRVA